MSVSILPSAKAVRELLEGLLGRDVAVRDGPPWVPSPADKIVVAEFVDDDGALAAIGLVDMPGGAFIGAAMGLLPKGGAEDMAKEGALSALVSENLYETLNIVSSLFNTADQPHVRIGAMHGPGATLPETTAAAVNKPIGRLDLAITVAGYGDGRLSLVTA